MKPARDRAATSGLCRPLVALSFLVLGCVQPVNAAKDARILRGTSARLVEASSSHVSSEAARAQEIMGLMVKRMKSSSSLSPEDLLGMEDVIVKLAKTGHMRSPVVSTMVEKMKKLLEGMYLDIEGQHNLAQERMDKMKEPFKACETSHSSQDIIPLRNSMWNCRQSQTGKYDKMSLTCGKAKELQNSRELKCGQFDALNRLPDEVPSMCNAKSFDSSNEAHAKRLRDYYDNYVKQLKELGAQCKSIAQEESKAYADCQKDSAAFRAAKDQCDTKQREFDDAACTMFTNWKKCEDSASCFQQAGESFKADNVSVATSEQGRAEQWIAIKRIECFLDVFNTGSTGNIESTIQECGRRTFTYGLSLNYVYNQNNLPSATGTCSRPTIPLPGSPEYVSAYFSQQNQESAAPASCVASCCTMCTFVPCGSGKVKRPFPETIKGSTEEECCASNVGQWKADPWPLGQVCDTQCGIPEVVQTREVKCMVTDSNNRASVASNSMCGIGKPDSFRVQCKATEPCVALALEKNEHQAAIEAAKSTVQWVYDEWSFVDCSLRKCGEPPVLQVRKVQCKNVEANIIEDDEKCGTASAPTTQREACPASTKCFTCRNFNCPASFITQTPPPSCGNECTAKECCFMPMVLMKAERLPETGFGGMMVNRGAGQGSLEFLGDHPIVSENGYALHLSGKSKLSIGDDQRGLFLAAQDRKKIRRTYVSDEQEAKSFTVEAYLKVLPSAKDGEQTIIQKNGGFENKGVWSITVDNQGEFMLRSSGSAEEKDSDIACRCPKSYLNEWAQVALSYDGKGRGLTLLVNGAECCTASASENKKWTDTEFKHPLNDVTVGSNGNESNNLNADIHSFSLWDSYLESNDLSNLAERYTGTNAAWGPQLNTVCKGPHVKSDYGVASLDECKAQCRSIPSCRAAVYYLHDQQACHSLGKWACAPGQESDDCQCAPAPDVISMNYLRSCTKGSFVWKIEVTDSSGGTTTGFSELSLRDSGGLPIQQGAKPTNENGDPPAGCALLNDGARDGTDCAGKSSEGGGYWKYDFNECALPSFLAFGKSDESSTENVPRKFKVSYERPDKGWQECNVIKHKSSKVQGIAKYELDCPQMDLSAQPYWKK